MAAASSKPVRRTAAPAGVRRSTPAGTKAGGKAAVKRAASPSTAGREAKPLIRRTGERVYVDGIPASTLVGKYPSVRAQPAPAAPRHFTQDQISAAVARWMKLG